uniref:Uncharacterized protein n=1 Tax=Bos taurus TaxID=9913 RepID=A0ABI0NQN8_BOVIN
GYTGGFKFVFGTGTKLFIETSKFHEIT